jgi:hypothetical protein
MSADFKASADAILKTVGDAQYSLAGPELPMIPEEACVFRLGDRSRQRVAGTAGDEDHPVDSSAAARNW